MTVQEWFTGWKASRKVQSLRTRNDLPMSHSGKILMWGRSSGFRLDVILWSYWDCFHDALRVIWWEIPGKICTGTPYGIVFGILLKLAEIGESLHDKTLPTYSIWYCCQRQLGLQKLSTAYLSTHRLPLVLFHGDFSSCSSTWCHLPESLQRLSAM